MARHTFGRSLTDWTMDIGDTTTVEGVVTGPVIGTGPATITFWSAKSGGVQYTDLLGPSGTAATTISSSDGSDGLPVGTIPEFSGPDEVFEMWADAGGGARYKMVCNDVGNVVKDLLATVLDQQETIDTLSNSPGCVVYNSGTSSWPDRPVDSRPYFWIGPSAPALIPDGDLWINTTPA
ncbi:hypothetical protein [Actinomadura madurae]|nr:hypothetical protein [Actinomadura madurae]MCP9947285.1 hypothetical protein [Actinomadura madurae]MCP9964047.1 hypothetical protein [Actinomadura madurae]MCP9976521.1 hypothetical protein [Actinomadura madurae]MCQ0012719.1 hypothetical protein [Actinomadura madurae]